MLSCQRCKQTINGPQAFLLTCWGCNKTWHHRCHQPPVEDVELIGRIRATNAGDKANGLTTWMCRRCRKGGSETPSVTSSREQTVSSDSQGRRSLISGHRSAPVADTSASRSTSASTTSVTPTADVRIKQESHSAVVDSRLLNDRERDKQSDRRESTRVAQTKNIKPPAGNRSHVHPQPAPPQAKDVDVPMADATATKLTLQGKKISSPRLFVSASSNKTKGARKSADIVPATSSEDAEMELGDTSSSYSEPTSRATSQASQSFSSDDQAVRPNPVVEDVHASGSTNERDGGVKPVGGGAVQPRVNQDVANEMNDDPEDLYGPPVERRIIRILPSLAEELREQQRRAAAEKEKRRAPLAPDWIYAKHAHDPLWKEIPKVEGRTRRKMIARKLGDNGLNVNELMGCFTVQNWVRERKV